MSVITKSLLQALGTYRFARVNGASRRLAWSAAKWAFNGHLRHYGK